MSAEDAIEEIRGGTGGQFAPAVAQAMLRLCERDPADFGLQTHRAAV